MIFKDQKTDLTLFLKMNLKFDIQFLHAENNQKVMGGVVTELPLILQDEDHC